MSIPDELKRYYPMPHPSRETFRRHKFKIPAVANALGVSSGYCHQLLSGYARVSPKHEKKLRELETILEGGAK